MRNDIQRHTLLFFVAIATVLAACHRANPQREALYLQADSLLTDHPDSALCLLQSPLASTSPKLTHRECARYALLLAQATDKCQKPLLPCDSLLDVALDYYDNDNCERAMALLYKGRLETEKGQNEQAIAHLQQSLRILQKFPNKKNIKVLVNSSLGNLYMDEGYYREAFNIYRELYSCAHTSKDKFIALNNMSNYYLMTEQADSGLILQQKSQVYAYQANDSGLIATSNLNLSISHSANEQLDSAIYYAKQAIQYLPEWKKKKSSNYYGNLGDLLARKGELEDAAYYLNESLKDSTNLSGTTATLLSLYEIEKEKGDYKSAITYLERHVDIIDSLSYTECSTETQRLINAHQTQMKVYEERIQKEKLILVISIVFTTLIFSIIFSYQVYIQRKKKQLLLNRQALQETNNKIAFLQTAIQEEQSNILFLKKEKEELKHEQRTWIEKIAEKEQHIALLEKQELLLRNWQLAQTPVYKKIVKIASQKSANKKEQQILTLPEQEIFKKNIQEIYANHMRLLNAQYPKLTKDDLIYLCLQETELSPLAIAIGFGYSDTHPLNQKKLRIKERMEQEATVKCDSK